ncbi:hypothetical protein [Sulfurimonas sp.]|uniref:hypothetical protein n=1 Tax=Sulfurimonas sp. TaxID=2022749 RepID=UPI0025FE03DE|nr:hypothetical protein [Sulfurimonas sp.]
MLYEKAWIGSSAPESNDSWVLIPELLIKETFHRISPSLHGRFQEIYFLENNLADFVTWPIVLDELLRLTQGKAKIHIKIRFSSSFFSIATFNNKVYSSTNGKIKLLSFEVVSDSVILSFEVDRAPKILDNNWTFGIVWDGKNKHFLESFIKSVHQQSTSVQYEIIICGPVTNLENDENCIFISADELTEQLSNISVKKNMIVENANFSNVCIVHNRYQLDTDFIKSFTEFGLDYDVVVVKQIMQDGQRVPDWITQGSNFIFTQNYLMEYDDYSPYQYIGGGMIVAKREILLKHQWNSIGVWNTGEDIELSERLRGAGIQARFNPFTYATVLSLRQGILEDFILLKSDDIYKNSYDVYNNKILFSKSLFLKLKAKFNFIKNIYIKKRE